MYHRTILIHNQNGDSGSVCGMDSRAVRAYKIFLKSAELLHSGEIWWTLKLFCQKNYGPKKHWSKF